MKESTRLRQIRERLQQEYGTRNLGQKQDAIDGLVSIFFSEKTDEGKDVEACRFLDDAFGCWEDVAHAWEEHIASRGTVTRIGERRVRLIRSALVFIIERYGDLRSFCLQDVRRAERELITIPGMGAKTARWLLLYCFGRHVLPVDVHTYRLAVRLGIISWNVSYEQSHDLLQSIFPWNHRRKFHINAVAHGRKRCRAKRPLCDGCPVAKFCSVPRAKIEIQMSVHPKLLVLDLFSGAGGLSQGFLQGDFEVVQAVEKDQKAADTYSKNHKRSDVLVADIAELNPLEMSQRIGLRRGDLTAIIGGPPLPRVLGVEPPNTYSGQSAECVVSRVFPVRCRVAATMVCIRERSRLKDRRKGIGLARNPRGG